MRPPANLRKKYPLDSANLKCGRLRYKDNRDCTYYINRPAQKAGTAARLHSRLHPMARAAMMISAERRKNPIVSSIMNAAGFGAPQSTVLPAEIVTAIEDCGFFESIPLWAVTLIGGLFIWVLSFVMILSVYGRFFKMYMYAALAPIPLSSFAGEPSQNVGKRNRF